MSFRMEGKTALVTGAGSGIGAACAEALASAGAMVMITDLREDLAKKSAESIVQKGGRADFARLDVAREEDWDAVASETVKAFGGWDVLVNNAGVEIAKPLTDMSVEEWKFLFGVNVEGVFLGTRSAVRVMRPGGQAGHGGSIINLSSVAGMKGYPGFTAYGASKGAVRQFSRAAAVECGPLNIRVNSLHPGVIRTEMGARAIKGLAEQAFGGDQDTCRSYLLGMTPLGRLGESPDIASAVLFLASDASRFVTGIELVVDGGIIA